MSPHRQSQPCYLLILACSQRKRPDAGFLPAIERYDGVNFRVLQKAKREGYLPENLDIVILSAKYGLIEASTPIENYALNRSTKFILLNIVKQSPNLLTFLRHFLSKQS